MKSAIQNFQIPTVDFERAWQFYSAVMNYKLQRMEFQGMQMGIFNFEQGEGIGGTIMHGDGRKPSKDGTLVYLHAGSDLAPYLERIATAGGKVVVDKTPLGPNMGFFAIFDDSEDNRVGLYSMQ